MSANTVEEFKQVLRKFGEGYGLTSIERAVIISGVLDLTSQRDRALEAAEKLMENAKLVDTHVHFLKLAIDSGDPKSELLMRCADIREALTATEPKPVEPALDVANNRRDALITLERVELPKCDHCGAIACGTDCNGSSHYTPEGKR